VFAKVPAPGAPDGIAVAADGTVYVATNNGTAQGSREASKIMAFDAAGKTGRSYVISGQPTDHAVGVTGLALDGHGGIVALDASTGRVVRIDLKSGAQSQYATLPNAAPCSLVVAAPTCEPGVQDRAPLPTSAVFDRAGNLYVADAGQATIWRIPSGGGTPAAWYQASDLATGNGLSGLAFDGSGNLLATSPQPVDVTALNGGLYRIPVQPNGSASARQLVAAFARGDVPAGVTTADGGFVVALQGANAVVVLDGSGKELHRVAGADTKLDAPSSLAFAPNGTLLATNQAPATPDDWSILAVGIR
jgi:sugar lactone lactonase YvrE